MLKTKYLVAKIGADTAENEPLKERESEMSHFARPQKSRRVQEMARLGRPFGFTSWSNEENRDREK